MWVGMWVFRLLLLKHIDLLRKKFDWADTLSASPFCLTLQGGSDGAAHARRRAVALASPGGFEP